MPVNLTAKNVPDLVVQRLKERAERHHRSLQDELVAILQDAVRDQHPVPPAPILAEIRELGLRTSEESASIVRAHRDGFC